MSSHENDLVERLHAVAEGFEMPAAPLADDVHRGRRRVRRRRGLVAGVAAATVTVVLVVTAAVTGQDQAGPDRQEPVERPDVVLGAGPVWYDANGLHHGDVVEQTPVEIGGRGAGPGAIRGAVRRPQERRRVVPPLGWRAPNRGTRLGTRPGRGPER